MVRIKSRETGSVGVRCASILSPYVMHVGNKGHTESLSATKMKWVQAILDSACRRQDLVSHSLLISARARWPTMSATTV